MKTAIAVRHVAFEDLGSLEEVLRAREISVRYVEAGIDDLASIAPEAADLAIVLGGPIGVYEIEQYPFLVQEIEWLRARLSRDLPTVGICLGAQMMAAALVRQYCTGMATRSIFPQAPGTLPARSVILTRHSPGAATGWLFNFTSKSRHGAWRVGSSDMLARYRAYGSCHLNN